MVFVKLVKIFVGVIGFFLEKVMVVGLVNIGFKFLNLVLLVVCIMILFLIMCILILVLCNCLCKLVICLIVKLW